MKRCRNHESKDKIPFQICPVTVEFEKKRFIDPPYGHLIYCDRRFKIVLMCTESVRTKNWRFGKYSTRTTIILMDKAALGNFYKMDTGQTWTKLF